MAAPLKPGKQTVQLNSLGRASRIRRDPVERYARRLVDEIGFVGAAESKAELAANSRGVPFVIMQGRLGGSAMAAAACDSG